MKKVCIIVGHSAKDGGAHNANFDINEYQYNAPLASLLAVKLHDLGVLPVIVFRSSYSRMIKDVNATSADFAIELHCNSVADKSAHGAEVLHWHTSNKSKAIAAKLQNVLVDALDERDRGLKPISEGGDDNRGWQFLKRTNMPSVILEPFFLSNDKSLTNGMAKRELLADELAKAIANHLLG